jgi:hypothetical protein
MDQAADDERLRRLQRLAFGPVASDAEQAAAIAELELIRLERAAGGDAGRGRTDAGGAPTVPASPDATAAGSSGPPEIRASGTAATRRLRWALALGAAALIIGVVVAVGGQVGWRISDAESSRVAVSAAPGVDAPGIPIGDTAVLRLYDAAASPADVLQGAYPRDSIAPTEYRLLLTRPDGVSLYIARLHGDAAICAVVTRPGDFTASSCTRDGMFPEAGLWVEVFVEGDLGLIRGAIQPNGVAELSPAGYVPGPLPDVGG